MLKHVLEINTFINNTQAQYFFTVVNIYIHRAQQQLLDQGPSDLTLCNQGPPNKFW